MIPRPFAPLLLAAALCTGCRPTVPTAVLHPSQTTSYDARGVVQKFDATGRRAVIAHEAIPGYMEAMTMEFDVAAGALTAEIARGDLVEFRLAVNDTHGWIESLTRTGHTALAPVADTALPEVGTPLPDGALTDERGQPFRLGDYRGRVFAFTFFYTRCPFPDFCPLIANRFGEVQRLLPASGDWSLLSISLDPTTDTPAVLAAHARKVGAADGRWRFATGDAEQLEKLSAPFGLAVVRAGAVLNHNLRTVVVGTDGRVRRIFTGNQWSAAELAAEMQRALAARASGGGE